jgi:hypothetical protein
MITILYIFFIVQCINIITKSIFLSLNKYPREQTYKPYEDTLALLFSIVFAIWIGYYLFYL